MAKRIIPCFDVKDGKVVKDVQFANLKASGYPAELAAIYEEQGADELVFLDITASHEKRGIILDIVKRTAARPRAGKADAALAASIFHRSQYSVKEVKEYLTNKRVLVRPV